MEANLAFIMLEGVAIAAAYTKLAVIATNTRWIYSVRYLFSGKPNSLEQRGQLWHAKPFSSIVERDTVLQS